MAPEGNNQNNLNPPPSNGYNSNGSDNLNSENLPTAANNQDDNKEPSAKQVAGEVLAMGLSAIFSKIKFWVIAIVVLVVLSFAISLFKSNPTCADYNKMDFQDRKDAVASAISDAGYNPNSSPLAIAAVLTSVELHCSAPGHESDLIKDHMSLQRFTK